MISVIVPVYKAEKSIARCIESVIAQEYQDWELILVDDGSPDCSGKICDEYAEKDKRIRVIHQANAGASSARNHGIVESRGDHVCFIDSDDYVSDKYLSDFGVKQNDIDFAVQGMTQIYVDGRSVETCCSSCHFTGFFCDFIKDSSVWMLLQGPCCKLYRTVVLQQCNISFPENLSYSEDGVFVLRYLQHCEGKLKIIPTSNYYYTHENDSSLTSKFHKGNELYTAVLSQFQEFELLCKTQNVTDSFVYYYRHHLAIDYYQSVYNTLVDNCVSFRDKSSAIWDCDRKLRQFIAIEKNLPKCFAVMRYFVKLIDWIQR